MRDVERYVVKWMENLIGDITFYVRQDFLIDLMNKVYCEFCKNKAVTRPTVAKSREFS